MRRAVVLLGMVAFLLVAAPASAQEALRDPFDPLIDPDATTTTTTTTGAPTDPTDPGDTDPVPVDPNDGLPSTGADPRNWFAFAYVLIAAGGMLVLLARSATPGPVRAPR